MSEINFGRCPDCGREMVLTPRWKLPRHNESTKKFAARCPGSGKLVAYPEPK